MRGWGDKLIYVFQDVNASLEYFSWLFFFVQKLNPITLQFFFLYETGAQFEFQTKY